MPLKVGNGGKYEESNDENSLLAENKRYVRRRKYKRPSPIKIHNVNSTEEDIETKTGVQKRPNVNHDRSPTLEPQENVATPTKTMRVVPFKPLYPRGALSPKVSRFIRSTSDSSNYKRSPLASPSNARSPVASPGSDFGFLRVQVMNSPSVSDGVQTYASTPSKPSSLSNVIDIDDILLEDSNNKGTPQKPHLVAEKTSPCVKKEAVKKAVDTFMDKLISITPTRQTLKSERGDFNILREHLKTNRRYVLISNKKK